MTEFTPTPEQEAIIQATKDMFSRSPGPSMMIKAYAGCSKTTTLAMLAKVLPHKPTLALAFNVKIKKDLEKAFPGHFEVKTMNGLGHIAWGRAIGRRCEIDDRKVGKLITSISKAREIDLGEDGFGTILALVRAARQAGLVPAQFPYRGLVEDTDLAWQTIADDEWLEVGPEGLWLAHEVLVESCKLAFQGVLDFDDQIYCSTMLGGQFPRFGIVLVDEAQDLSPLNHIQLKKVATDRLIIVGDPKQAIYAFRGADSQSMGKIKALRPEWLELPLHRTFRCPKVVVARQQGHAPGFTAHDANAEGVFSPWGHAIQDGTVPPWTWARVNDARPSHDAPIAILCRNNAPLLSLAFRLIRQRVGVLMLGRDIGKGLIQLSKKVLPNDDIPQDRCQELIEQWREIETQNARQKENESKVAGITDRAESLQAVLESGPCATAGDLRRSLHDLFSRETGVVHLATGHRAKGLEWDMVIHLDPWRVPSKHARRALEMGNPSPMEQELNLKYVIETRTRHTLVLANLEQFE